MPFSALEWDWGSVAGQDFVAPLSGSVVQIRHAKTFSLVHHHLSFFPSVRPCTTTALTHTHTHMPLDFVVPLCMQRLSRAYLESCFGASCCRNMPLKPPRPAAGRGGGRGQRQPKPGCGHAAAVLSALATEATRPRFKSPQRAERSLKSAQKHRRALAWPRARRLHPGTPKWAVLAASVPSAFCRAF